MCYTEFTNENEVLNMILERAEKGDFDAIWAEMQQNFPREELREELDAKAVFDDPAYAVYHLVKDGERVGFITLWEFDGFVFGEHFVIYEAYRNRGLGGEAIDAVTARFGKMILEAEHPVSEIAARRLGFYRRHGFSVNPQPYFQPSYHAGEEDVPLALLSYPAPLTDAEFDDAVTRIYEVVYHRHDRGGVRS